MRPSHRALLATALFSVFGIAGLYIAKEPILPLVLYYGVLLIHTFISIRIFAAIAPAHPIQAGLDVVLVALYAALANSFGDLVQFTVFSGILFAVSIIKYSHMLRILLRHRMLLSRKIGLNALGAGLSAVAFLIASFFAETDLTAWMFFFVFAVANFYVLVLKPIYRVNEH